MLPVQGHPQLSGKFGANLSYMRLVSRYECSSLLIQPPDVLRLPMIMGNTFPAGFTAVWSKTLRDMVVKTAVVRDTAGISSPPLLSQGFLTWGIREQHSPTPPNVLMMKQVTNLSPFNRDTSGFIWLIQNQQ